MTRLGRELLEQQSATLQQALALIEELRSNEQEIEQQLTKASQDGFDLAVQMHKQGLLDDA